MQLEGVQSNKLWRYLNTLSNQATLSTPLESGIYLHFASTARYGSNEQGKGLLAWNRQPPAKLRVCTLSGYTTNGYKFYICMDANPMFVWLHLLKPLEALKHVKMIFLGGGIMCRTDSINGWDPGEKNLHSCGFLFHAGILQIRC